MRSDALESQTPPIRSRKTDGFLLLILAASLSLNVYLGWKLRQASNTPAPITIKKLPPGTKVDPITVVGVDGRQETISYGGNDKPTVLYVLSPSCVWCERNKANIEKLVELKGNSFRFVGLSLVDDGVKEYAETHHLSFPIYSKLSAETIRTLGLGGTPQTIVVSPDGRIVKNWSGAYTESSRGEVEEYFQVHLPGLTSGKG
jgi:peroxiredoxin